MERTLGHRFADVCIHTSGTADRLAARHGAVAFTVGGHVGFREGFYQPGTMVGDALLAHELAHVAQQEAARSGEPAVSNPSQASERDANRAAAAVVGGRWWRTGRSAGQWSPTRSVGVGLQFASCRPAEAEREPPDYLGAESRAALRQIERIVESADALNWLIPLGTAVSYGTSPEQIIAEAPSGGPDLSIHARALLGVPVIKWSRVLTVIDLLLVSHENDMNVDERRFWHQMRENVVLLRAEAIARSRGAGP